MSSTPTVSVREWTDVVRRARLGKTTKYIALVLATYADFTDGSRVYPGLATIAVAAEVNYKTAQNAIAQLLAAGLIETVQARMGVRERGTEYRLILGEQLLERAEILSPAGFRLAADRVGLARRRSHRTPHGTGRPLDGGQPTGRGVPEGEDSPPDGLSSAEIVQPGRPAGRVVHDEGRPTPRRRDAPPHATRTPIDQPTTTNTHSDSDLRTAVTHTRGTGPPQDPIPPPMSERCPHGLASRLRKDGKPSCALCRRGSPAPPANVVQLRPRSQPA